MHALLLLVRWRLSHGLHLVGAGTSAAPAAAAHAKLVRLKGGHRAANTCCGRCRRSAAERALFPHGTMLLRRALLLVALLGVFQLSTGALQATEIQLRELAALLAFLTPGHLPLVAQPPARSNTLLYNKGRTS